MPKHTKSSHLFHPSIVMFVYSNWSRVSCHLTVSCEDNHLLRVTLQFCTNLLKLKIKRYSITAPTVKLMVKARVANEGPYRV